MSGRKV